MPMKSRLPDRWDYEADVVCVGSGGGGLAAAITAHDHGSSALVLEKSDMVGGVTAYSMGEVWIPGNHLAGARGIEDSPASGFRYVKRLSMGLGEDRAIANQAIHGPVALEYFERQIGLKMTVIDDCPDYYYPHDNDSVAEGRTLEAEPFAAASLGDWQERTRVSPHVPYGLTHEDIFGNGGMANMLGWPYDKMAERLEQDIRCFGPGLAAYFVKGVLDRAIPIHTSMDVVELLGDGERVVGVRAIGTDGDIFVKANRGVVLAVSSYERDPDFAKTLGHHTDAQSMVMGTVDGAHLRLAGQLGARIARVPDVTLLGFHVPGEEQDGGEPLWRGALPFIGLPHTIVVNRAGKRFGNEGFYRDMFSKMDHMDGGTQSQPNYPCWVVFDAQARAKYPFGSIMPGAEFPDGFGHTADRLEELAAKIGVEPSSLVATVDRFNANARNGEDPDFARGTFPWGAKLCGDPGNEPNPQLGPLEQAPFYAVELTKMAAGGICSTGIYADEHCRAIDWNGHPIDGLYVAGNSMARMDNGAFMQSGVTNARGMTHGYLAGRHAAGDPSPLLDQRIGDFLN